MPVAAGSLPTEHACTAPRKARHTPQSAARQRTLQSVAHAACVVPFRHLSPPNANPPMAACGLTSTLFNVRERAAPAGASMRTWHLLCAVTASVLPWLPCEAASRYAPSDATAGCASIWLGNEETHPLACKCATQPGLCTPSARERSRPRSGLRRELLQATSAVGWGSARWNSGSIYHGGQAPSRSQVVEWPAAVARPTSTAPPPVQCTNESLSIKWRELPTVSGVHRTCNRQRRYQVSADYAPPLFPLPSPSMSYPAALPSHGSVPTRRSDDVLSQWQRAGRIRCHRTT